MSDLEWITEELSGQLAAHSKTTPFKTYWIEEGIWTYLQSSQGDRAGVVINKGGAFELEDEAKEAAELMDREA
jgi:hypothetical protein